MWSSIIKKWLTSPAEEQKLGVEDEVKEFEETARRIKMTLQDLEEREVKDDSVKLWQRELIDVAYDAEDVLDDYQYQVLHSQVEQRSVGSLDSLIKADKVPFDSESSFSSSSSLAKINSDLVTRIRQIRGRYDEITRDRVALHLTDDDGVRRNKSGIPSPHQTSHMVMPSVVVGRERDNDWIIDKVSHAITTLNPRMIIPIIGMGGVGKTTLAQLVYNNPLVHESFDLKAWVHVSSEFDLTRITKEILESVSGQVCGFTALSMIQDKLQENVKGNRLFLVLDDAWTDNLKQLLVPLESTRVLAIIVTARNGNVAKSVQTISPHNLDCLPTEISWSLFRHFALANPKIHQESHMVEIARQIAKKCGGLPLAVKSIAALLRYKTDEESWRDILESELWQSDENDEIFPALKLSYYFLPSKLKPCFRFCSLFPKGFVFDSEELINMWIAHGYVESRGKKRLKNVGRDWLNELHMRSLIQQTKEGKFNLHDLVHDLIRSISMEFYDKKDREIFNISKEVRHAYLKNMNLDATKPNLRSFIFVCDQKTIRPPNTHGMKRLRILYLRIVNLENVLSSISTFTHLRYFHVAIGLAQRMKQTNSLEMLLESLCVLYNLEILIIKCKYHKKIVLPAKMGNLKKLRYMRLSGSKIEELPESLSSLDNLQELDFRESTLIGLGKGITNLLSYRSIDIYFPPLSTTNGPDEEFIDWHDPIIMQLSNIGGKLTFLDPHSKLRICNDQQDGFDLVVVHKKVFSDKTVKYQKAEIFGDILQPSCNLLSLTIDGYKGIGYPIWSDCSSSGLNVIFLLQCYINGQTFLAELGQLSNLRMLSLIKIPSITRLTHESLRWLNRPSTFSSLEVLEFQDMDEWEDWDTLEPDCFSNLTKLTIKNCSKLRKIPTFISLKELKISKSGLLEIRLASDNASSSGIQVIDIRDCQQLTSLFGVQSASCVQTLFISQCPRLHVASSEVFPSEPQSVVVLECPQMKHWCRKQPFPFIEACGSEELKITNVEMIQKCGVKNLSLLTHLCVEDCTISEALPTPNWLPTSIRSLKFHKFRGCGLSFKQDFKSLSVLDIRDCQGIETLNDLHRLPLLRTLILHECSVGNFQPPEWLEKLEIHGCHKIGSLNLSPKNKSNDFTKDVWIMNCEMLTKIDGISKLRRLLMLKIEQCSGLRYVDRPRYGATKQIIECPLLDDRY
ncbi:hypothetical protein LUZ60_011236 [Juncus effusus]|nr:hypothetical protein LUZ60_011236 [Juncus effusus]